MSIFDDPNWLRSPNSTLSASIAPGTPQPDLSGVSALAGPSPDIRGKRTIGNVLHDIFSGSRIANNMRDPRHAAWGDLLSNIARISRGEDPAHPQEDFAQQLLAQDQQKAEWDRSGQARNAFAALLTNPTPESLTALAQVAPDIVSSYLTQRQSAQHEAAQEAHQNRVDDFNMSKPVTVGGNTYLTPKEGGGWDEHQTPVPPGYQVITSGDGQTYVVDKTSGKPVRQIGGQKPGVNKVVTVQGADGPELRMIDAQGNPVRTIGAAPPKGKQPDKVGSSGEVLGLLDNIQQGFNDLHGMKALPGEGSPIDALGRTSVGQAVGEQLGGKAAQKRLEINKNISNLQQQMLKSLPASATRTRFEQEMLQRGLPDPMKMSYGTAQTVIKQLRESYTRAVNELRSGTAPAASSGITPEQARAELARRQQGQ